MLDKLSFIKKYGLKNLKNSIGFERLEYKNKKAERIFKGFDFICNHQELDTVMIGL